MTKRKANPQKKSRPPHAPTKELRAAVQMLYIAGYTQEMLCGELNITLKTLRKHYRQQLDSGKAAIDAKVTQTIIAMACGGPGLGNWEKANLGAAIFYAKTRMNWQEPKQNVHHSGSIGNYDLSKLSDAELERVTKTLERAAIAGSQG